MSAISEFYRDLALEGEGFGHPMFTQLLSQICAVPCKRMLDIGCWDGTKTIQMKELLGVDEVFGMDFVPEVLASARARGIQTLCVDLNSELPSSLPSGYFDVIVCSEVIEHVFSPDALIDEIVRLLRPGGCAVLSTPNLSSWRNRLVLLLGWQPFSTEVSTRLRYGNPMGAPGPLPGHIRVFTVRALREMVQASGLKIERVIGLPASEQVGSGISRVAGWLDRFVIPLWPVLADRVAMCLRKPTEGIGHPGAE